MKKKTKSSLSSHATVKEAIQKRITTNSSSIIPGVDINELQHSLGLLKYALDYSEAIVDTVQLPLIVLNKKLEVLTANRAFYDTFKLSPSETENTLIYELNNYAWNIPKLKTLLEKILPTNSHLDNYEVEINHPHIGKRVMLLNARKTYRQVNNTEAILLAFEDVTIKKQLETQKDDFIGIVSHELKTPLTTIMAYSQLLGKYLKNNHDEKGSLYLSKMTNQMERLTQLIASFVNVYKIQTGKLILNKTSFILDNLIMEIISNYKLTNKSYIVEFRVHSNIPVYADRERIAQVLVNLISNAIKYSPKATKVIVKSIYEPKKVTVSVRDFGFGITKDEQKKVFERFYRVQNKKEYKISGLGLGLYITSEIIYQHKGKIWIVSEEGKGSTFYFTLPIKQTNIHKR